MRIYLPGQQNTLELYWRYYRNDDWENLYKLQHAKQNKAEFIAEMKRIKENSSLGFKAVQEIGLSDKMIFILRLNRARIPGCAKILWRDGKSEWLDIYTFADVVGEDWIVSSATVFYKQPGNTFKPCSKNISSLPLKIKVSSDPSKQ